MDIWLPSNLNTSPFYTKLHYARWYQKESYINKKTTDYVR